MARITHTMICKFKLESMGNLLSGWDFHPWSLQTMSHKLTPPHLIRGCLIERSQSKLTDAISVKTFFCIVHWMTYWVYVNAFTVHPLIVVLLPTVKVDFQQSEMELLCK